MYSIDIKTRNSYRMREIEHHKATQCCSKQYQGASKRQKKHVLFKSGVKILSVSTVISNKYQRETEKTIKKNTY